MGLVVAVVMPQLQCRPAHFKERFVHTHPAQKHRVTSPRLPVAEVNQLGVFFFFFFLFFRSCPLVFSFSSPGSAVVLLIFSS